VAGVLGARRARRACVGGSQCCWQSWLAASPLHTDASACRIAGGAWGTSRGPLPLVGRAIVLSPVLMTGAVNSLAVFKSRSPANLWVGGVPLVIEEEVAPVGEARPRAPSTCW